jgi:hypothetical protein
MLLKAASFAGLTIAFNIDAVQSLRKSLMLSLQREQSIARR